MGFSLQGLAVASIEKEGEEDERSSTDQRADASTNNRANGDG